MINFIYNICFLLVLVAVLCSAANDNSCDKYGTLVYEDIACTPVKTANDDCPTRYDCNLSQTKSGCLFKGKHYGLHEEIESNLTYSGCSVACRCNQLDTFLCASLDCPEHMGGKPGYPKCYFGYTLGKCCSTGQICDTTPNTKTCEVDGTTYKLGQRFYPKNTCLSCVCHEQFTGEYDENTCIRQNCNTQIHRASEIRQNCAPTYFKFSSEPMVALCCPDYFVCPKLTDDIRVVNDKAQPQPDLECAYGQKKLKLGEGFSTKVNEYGQERDLKCECVIPPLVTCKEI